MIHSLCPINNELKLSRINKYLVVQYDTPLWTQVILTSDRIMTVTE